MEHKHYFWLFTLCIFISGLASAKEQIQFAGFAFLGSDKHIGANYPYSLKASKLTNGKGQSRLDAELIKKLSLTETSFNIDTTTLADRRSGESLVLALALDRETIFFEKACGDYKLVIELSAQALIVDFENLSIVGAYPLVIQYIDAPEQQPTPDYIGQLVQQLYMGDLGINVVDEFIKIIAQIDVSKKYNHTIQVSQVVIGDEATPYLPDIFSGSNHDNFESFIAQNFSAALSRNQAISVLPFTKGYAIGNKMAARFANGDVYSLSIPESDYSVKITIPEFRKVLYDQRKTGSSWVYGSYAEVEVFEALSGRIYFNELIKNGETKLIPICQQSLSEWPAFQESMLVLFSEFTEQINVRNSSWAKIHSNKNSIKKQLKALDKVVSTCR